MNFWITYGLLLILLVSLTVLSFWVETQWDEGRIRESAKRVLCVAMILAVPAVVFLVIKGEP